MIVSGRVEMTPGADDEAHRQLDLRYRLGAATTDTYFDSGFSVVVQDVVVGEYLSRYIGYIRARPLHVVVLLPRPEVVERRESEREKTAYGSWTVQQLDDVLRNQTPRIGLWVDSSDQVPEQTVDEILRRRDEAGV